MNHANEEIIELQRGEIKESFVFGKVANLADNSVWYKQGDAIIIVALTVDDTPSDEDFLPFMVQYIEKSYAAAKIPGGFIKRESKPGEPETLTARIIDRSLRPLFPKDFSYPVTVTVMVVSNDSGVDMQLAALHAASVALFTSSLPVDKLVGAVRVAKIGGEIVFDPDPSALEASTLDLLVAGSEEGISMIELGVKSTKEPIDVPDTALLTLDSVVAPSAFMEYKHNTNAIKEDILVPLLHRAKEHLSNYLWGYQEALVVQKKAPRFDVKEPVPHDVVAEELIRTYRDVIEEALVQRAKSARGEAIKALKKSIIDTYKERYDPDVIEKAFERAKSTVHRDYILTHHKRADGRGPDEVRPIAIETNPLPSVHGSTLFRRGETQVLATVTLGDKKDAQTFELLGDKSLQSEHFMLHYNFPPFSVGETRPIGAPSRREIGHGHLAKKAIEPVISQEIDGAIRVVAEVLESNGSSSMATVCASVLALECAEVEIAELVAGVAIGVVKEGQREVILTDIMGLEDFDGDLDLKVAGTKEAITAMQMDVKCGSLEIGKIARMLEQAKIARGEILEVMQEAKSKIEPSKSLPQVEHFHIDPNAIKEIIGKAGATIREIIEKFEVAVDLDKNEGKVKLTGGDKEKIKAARGHIEAIASKTKREATQYEEGKVYKGKVKKIVDFGIFIELPDGENALLHISKIAKERIGNLTERFKEGDEIDVVVLSQKGIKIELATPEYVS